MNTINCGKHGAQAETFVCSHILGSLISGEAVGFWWSAEDVGNRPDAWCTDCEERLRQSAGEWTPRNLTLAKIQVLCATCYDAARQLWRQAAKDGRLRSLPPN